MRFTLGLYWPLLLSLFSPISAISIEPRDNLFTPTTTNSGNPSGTLDAPGTGASYHCVAPAQHPDWAGKINYNDCIDAFSVLADHFADIEDKEYTFYSRKYDRRPWWNGWELPYGLTRGKPSSQSLSAIQFFLLTHSRQAF